MSRGGGARGGAGGWREMEKEVEMVAARWSGGGGGTRAVAAAAARGQWRRGDNGEVSVAGARSGGGDDG